MMSNAVEMKGRVIKGIGGDFIVECEGKTFVCSNRGKIALLGQLLVGDYVEFTAQANKGRITKILPRKNALTRPAVANIDKMVVILASEPKPDYYLLDKMLVLSNEYSIDLVVVINKCDMSQSIYEYCNSVYGEMAKIIQTSALNGEGIGELVAEMKGVCCLIGQSAVGKSSLLNAIAGYNEKTGGLSKIKRGRNTTRKVEIFAVSEQISIIDTCGFSSLEMLDIPSYELRLYYPEYMSHSLQCKYTSCNHVRELSCAVKTAVANNELDVSRYERYLALYNELTEKEKKKYD